MTNNLVPLWPACLGTISGIIIQKYAQEPLWSLIICICITASWCVYRHSVATASNTMRLATIAILFLFLGAYASAKYETNYYHTEKLAHNAKSIEGTVVEIEHRQRRFSTKILVSIEQLDDPNEASGAKWLWTNFFVTIYTPLHGFEPGCRIKIIAPTIRKMSFFATHEEESAWQYHQIKNSSLGFIFHDVRCRLRRLEAPNKTFSGLRLNLRERIKNRLTYRLSPEAFKLFTSIFLGCRYIRHDDPVRNYCTYWGLAHFLARSGLHIMLYGGIWLFLLSLLPLSIRTRYILLMITTGIYALLSWSSISFIRAYWLFVLVGIGKICMLTTQPSHLISLLSLEILLHNPLQLFALDFQLSFALAFSLSLLMRLRAMHLLE